MAPKGIQILLLGKPVSVALHSKGDFADVIRLKLKTGVLSEIIWWVLNVIL